MASTALPTSDAPAQSAPSWDEERYRAALVQLEQLQQQLDDLRLTIPRIIAPLSTHHTRTTAFYAHFKQAAVGATSGLKAFRSQWQSQEIQSIFEYAKKSYTSDAELGPSAQVPKYGWAESVSSGPALAKLDSKEDFADDPHAQLTTESISQIVKDFVQEHPSISTKTSNNGSIILISVPMAHLVLKFRIVIHTGTNVPFQIHAECLGNVKLSAAITRCLSSRPRAKDLKYLLDMICAYNNESKELVACANCSQTLDSSGLLPAARRSKQAVDTSGNVMTIWEPFHERCVTLP